MSDSGTQPGTWKRKGNFVAVTTRQKIRLRFQRCGPVDSPSQCCIRMASVDRHTNCPSRSTFEKCLSDPCPRLTLHTSIFGMKTQSFRRETFQIYFTQKNLAEHFSRAHERVYVCFERITSFYVCCVQSPRP